MNSLTQCQTNTLQAVLAKRTGELAAEIRAALLASDDLHYRDIAGSVTDTADEALARSLVDVEAAFLDRHVRELRDIDAARERMQQGCYGVCVDCGDTVPYARLSAYPAAKRCFGCQQQREQKDSSKTLSNL